MTAEQFIWLGFHERADRDPKFYEVVRGVKHGARTGFTIKTFLTSLIKDLYPNLSGKDEKTVEELRSFAGVVRKQMKRHGNIVNLERGGGGQTPTPSMYWVSDQYATNAPFKESTKVSAKEAGEDRTPAEPTTRFACRPGLTGVAPECVGKTYAWRVDRNRHEKAHHPEWVRQHIKENGESPFGGKVEVTVDVTPAGELEQTVVPVDTPTPEKETIVRHPAKAVATPEPETYDVTDPVQAVLSLVARIERLERENNELREAAAGMEELREKANKFDAVKQLFS